MFLMLIYCKTLKITILIAYALPDLLLAVLVAHMQVCLRASPAEYISEMVQPTQNVLLL